MSAHPVAQRPDGLIGQRRPLALVVEDDPDELDPLVRNLIADRFDVISVGTGADALREVEQRSPDLALIDEGLPDMSGLDVVATIRAGSPYATWDPGLSIVMLTGRADSDSVVRAMTRGADDFVAKPYHYPELLARITANLRRRQGVTLGGHITVGALEIDRRAMRAFVNGRPLDLCAKEFGLLAVLARDPSRAIPKFELLRDVWGFEHQTSRTRTIDTHACRLRRKLEAAGISGWVRNLWGYGYRLLPEER